MSQNRLRQPVVADVGIRPPRTGGGRQLQPENVNQDKWTTNGGSSIAEQIELTHLSPATHAASPGSIEYRD